MKRNFNATICTTRRYRWLCFTVALALMPSVYTWSQSTVLGYVVDSDTKEPLIYCHIMIASRDKGTITNEDGEFELSGVIPGDTVVVSYIGYHSKRLSIADLMHTPIIELRQQYIELGELVIYGEDEYLYKAVAKCRALMLKQPAQTSKVYFHLETTSNNTPLEMIQCYYNGTSQGCASNFPTQCLVSSIALMLYSFFWM